MHDINYYESSIAFEGLRDLHFLLGSRDFYMLTFDVKIYMYFVIQRMIDLKRKIIVGDNKKMRRWLVTDRFKRAVQEHRMRTLSATALASLHSEGLD